MIRAENELLAALRAIHDRIRDRVVAACETQATAALSRVVEHAGGDQIFAIDRISEDELLTHFNTLARRWPLVLIAEGLEGGRLTLPRGTDPAAAEIVVIVDPIDGTRGLMYQKRPGWILTGVALNRGPDTDLRDICLALQTEIPLVKQHLSDALWCGSDGVVGGLRHDRLTGAELPLRYQPSAAASPAQGFGCCVRFFPGGRDITARLDDELMTRLLGPQPAGAATAFEDQYPCTGGQLYQLIAGQDRWVADLRPLLARPLAARGEALGHCCHPYDLCTERIARAAGVVVCGVDGSPPVARLDVSGDLTWLGFANATLSARMLPVLRALLGEYGLLES